MSRLAACASAGITSLALHCCRANGPCLPARVVGEHRARGVNFAARASGERRRNLCCLAPGLRVEISDGWRVRPAPRRLRIRDAGTGPGGCHEFTSRPRPRAPRCRCRVALSVRGFGSRDPSTWRPPPFAEAASAATRALDGTLKYRPGPQP